MSKTRVLVLGGGMGSLAALMEMTSEPNWRDRFDITVLQQGWRLGGKCASSRDPAHRQRNEEHGLHVLGGFYHNTFKMLRSCYDDWKGYFPHAIAFKEAFQEKDSFVLAQKLPSGWSKITMPGSGPGEPGEDPPFLTPLGIAKSLIRFVGDVLSELPEGLEVYGEPGQLFVDQFRETADAFEALDLRHADQSRLEEIIALVKPLELTVQQVPPEALRKPIDRIIPEDLLLGRILSLVLIELGLLIPRAMLQDKVIFHGFDIINSYDALDWLRHHQASNRLLESTFINSGYEYGFAYVDGDLAKKDFAAGVALRGLLRLLLTYHGSVFVHMTGGMGEIVIAPLYEVLTRRGVKFQFFHQVTRLVLSDDGNQVASVEGLLQAQVRAGVDRYDPLVDWHGRKVWPAKPKYELLVNGDELQRQGTDFSLIGPIPRACLNSSSARIMILTSLCLVFRWVR